MILNERQLQILNILNEYKSIAVSELSSTLKVSSVTIRKDLSLMEKEGLLYRTHGSAVLSNPYISNRHINEKEKLKRSEKHSIATFAASQIEPHDSIIIASGTTMHAFAREIQSKEELTVITSAIEVSTILSQRKGITTIQLGGVLRTHSASAIGSYAEKMLDDFLCSKLYLGVDGIDIEHGITTTNTMEATLNRKMIASAQKVIVLADSSKFGRRGLSKICPVESVDLIITDKGAPQKTLEKLQENGVEVVVVE